MPSGHDLFLIDDLTGLRDDLRRAGLDSWQAAELISAFLIARGYGVSHDDARDAVMRMDSWGASVQTMQEELGRLALVM